MQTYSDNYAHNQLRYFGFVNRCQRVFLPQVNEYFDYERGDKLLLLQDLGVDKVTRFEFEEPVGLGAFSYLEISEFVAHLQSIDWPEPEFVKCLISSGAFDGFQVFQMEGKNKDI